MAKTANINVRVDESLKQRAHDVLDEMGLPMSLAVEMFLKQVADKGRLPFKVGEEGPSAEETKAAARRERDFWKAFSTWYFQVWPMFDSPEVAQIAEQEYGFTCHSAGSVACGYITGDSEGLGSMSDAQREAYFDVSDVQRLLSEAKELVYWALDMEKVFVPRLSAAYADKADLWRMSYLKKTHKGIVNEDEPPVAEGVIGARYFGVD